MAEIEAAARFALACQFGLLAIVLLRDHRASATGLLAGLFALAGFADQVTAPFGPRQGLTGAVFQAASISGAVWFWLLAKSLFNDRFHWRTSYLAVLILLLTCSLGAYFFTDGFSLIQAESALAFDRYKASLLPQQAIILILAILVVFEAIRDWRSDLVESRRRFRRYFVIGFAVLILVVSFSNFLRLGNSPMATFDAVSNLAGLILVMLLVSMMLRVRSSVIPVTIASPFPSVGPQTEHDPLVASIRAAMEKQQLYTEHGLTIAALATHLKEQEYRVRQAINGNMGYRNFNQFLNHYRVGEAARRLIAEDTRRLPVLTIAIDVGYGSLAPFNIAFKAAHGMTPTAYRKQHGVK